ncbi:hypothetical protein D3870_11045 [Noviherbaspirillum cavernae]|uniref:Phosphoglycerate mutase n=1 Tax=Noviherbaspirillum cavernae TaxID=2320862 RepID=A0A418X1Z9_9BURK|nr:hypothetical protein [Noviherbaspirillum cavernae]RJG06477.1 hypothetical protein D3870_11045 [Noviherbaspirillum cavernae]
MSHLDILIPFGLPPEELATDLFRELKTPALATLVARARRETPPAIRQSADGISRALPHEAWLASRFGLEEQMHVGGSPPIATAAMRALGLAHEPGIWFMLNPVHFHIARDHLVLPDLRQLALTERESRTLFDIAQPLFEEVGKPLRFGNATSWFVRADDWSRLQTSTPDAACGHNIDIWMPKGEGERNWRKLQNEVQMHWFTGSLNAERESKGLKPVNSIWLWGGAQASMDGAKSPYTELIHLDGWMRAFAQFGGNHLPGADAGTVIAAAPERGLLLLDQLLEPALGNDWAQWLINLEQLEAEWFAPLLAALKTGKLDRLTLIPTHHARIAAYTTGKNTLRKFWIKPALTNLLP